MIWTLPALGGTLVGAVGTVDVTTAQILAGLEASVLGDQEKGFRPHGRLMVGIDPIDVLPTGTTELGFTGVPRVKDALVRAGMFVRVSHMVRRQRIAIELPADEGKIRYGIGFAAAAMAEIVFTPEAPWVLGGHVGMGHWSAIRQECVDVGFDDRSELPEGCLHWPVSVVAGGEIRKTFKNGFTARVRGGTMFEVGFGYLFRPKKTPAP